MNILDSTAIIYAFDNKICLKSEYYITDDLDEEFEVAELRHDSRRDPIAVMPARSIKGFNKGYYLKMYKQVLDSHRGYSFVKMTGFGDISIIALVKSLQQNFGRPVQRSLDLFGEDDVVINIYTSDKRLHKRLVNEFGSSIGIKSNNELG